MSFDAFALHARVLSGVRAVGYTENVLAYGRAHEPPPARRMAGMAARMPR